MRDGKENGLHSSLRIGPASPAVVQQDARSSTDSGSGTVTPPQGVEIPRVCQVAITLAT
jgi:hypothetical protein